MAVNRASNQGIYVVAAKGSFNSSVPKIINIKKLIANVCGGDRSMTRLAFTAKSSIQSVILSALLATKRC